jgi:hypothetical protein
MSAHSIGCRSVCLYCTVYVLWMYQGHTPTHTHTHPHTLRGTDLT